MLQKMNQFLFLLDKYIEVRYHRLGHVSVKPACPAHYMIQRIGEIIL